MSQKTVGITGPQGFVATHLRHFLDHSTDVQVATLPREAWRNVAALQNFVRNCDVIVHLAGQNRGPAAEVYHTNVTLAETFISALDETNVTPHVIFSSSTQRDAEGQYGKSKLEAERLLSQWATGCGAPLTNLVIPNVYGAGCRPHYNSVVATFCHELTHGGQPQVIEDREVEFLWVNHLVEEIWRNIQQPPAGIATNRLAGNAQLKVSELLQLLEQFRDDYFSRGVVPDLSSPLDASLYSTFLSYVELDDHRHRPEVKADDRGELFEIIKMTSGGQVFFSTTKPGIVRGNHYHTRKVEWFCVLKGEAAIRLRHVTNGDVREFRVSGDQPEFISIPVFHTHHIENVGQSELLTMFWCNEIFDAADPDTHYAQVA